MRNSLYHPNASPPVKFDHRRVVQLTSSMTGVFVFVISILLLAGCSPRMGAQPAMDDAGGASAAAMAANVDTGDVDGSSASTEVPTETLIETVRVEPVVTILAATVAPSAAPTRAKSEPPTPTPDSSPVPRRTGEITEALVNVRHMPALDAEIVTRLKAGSLFDILDVSEDGEWFKICCAADTGWDAWINIAQVREVKAAELGDSTQSIAQSTTQSAALSDTAPALNPAQGPVGLINATLVNVRGGPGTGYRVIGQAGEDERYQLTGRNEDGSWLQICCVDDQTDSELGWISTDFVDAISSVALNGALPVVEAPPTPEPLVETVGTGAAQAAQLAAAPAPGLPGDGGFGQPSGTNPLTGLPLAGGRAAQRPIIVCINNDYAARPQFGISQADVMYEYLMEGFGITRFSGVFYGEDVGQIGPVRSARLINYYMTPLYKAGLACSGASDRVRYTLKFEMPAPYMDIDLDDPSNTRYTVSIGGDYRTRLRASMDGLRRWLAEWGVEQSAAIRGFTFGGAPGGGVPASAINIPYPRGTGSQVSYQYDGGSGRYLRFLGGGPHLDGNSGAQVGVENVVIQYVPHEVTDIVEDSLGSRSIRLNLFGSGRVIVFREGQAYTGLWRSDSQGDTPRFYTDNGAEILLKPGHTWVSVVPLDYGIEYQ